MNRLGALIFLLGGTIAFAVGQDAKAAEIRLRAQCGHAGALVVLGDLADIFAVNDDELARLKAIELFPAPARGETRFVRINEIQDLLALRGENLLHHTFSGSSQVKITHDAGVSARPTMPASLQRRRMEQQIRDAIASHLTAKTQGESGWQIELDLHDESIRAFNTVRGEPRIQGGRAPWLGEQTFQASYPGGATVRITARISRSPRVVAAARTVRRGAIIQRDDVRLVPAESVEKPSFSSLEDVVGQETTRALTAGQWVSRDLVHPPTLVSRGKVVTVFARTAGITIRSTARAQENGALGDLIPVESLLNRKRFFALVSGVQEVEVYARGRHAQRPAPGVLTRQDAKPSQDAPRLKPRPARSPGAGNILAVQNVSNRSTAVDATLGKREITMSLESPARRDLRENHRPQVRSGWQSARKAR